MLYNFLSNYISNMKHHLIILLVAVAAMFTSAAYPANTIRKGVLPNGLTYYIMRNESPGGQADFFLVQKVGSVYETEEERGLAHFLEHLAFNGTRHFPGNTLISYLEGLGVKFGANLNASTSTDETIYNICKVPALRATALDSCLLILRDWSADLLLTDEDIDAERGVIEGEWRHRSSATNRILESVLPKIYPGSMYGKRMPIGLMKVIRNFKPETLRNFYRKWHRPDNQAVIVVGDIDPDAMEAKVKTTFSDLTNPTEAPQLREMPIPDNDKIIVAIGTDPEQHNNVLQLHFKHSRRITSSYWHDKALENLTISMLAARYDSIEASPDCPYLNLGIGHGRFLLSRPMQSFVLRGTTKTGREAETLSTWYTEVKRAIDFGFTDQELQHAKAEYIMQLNARARNAASTTNTEYARRCVRNFLQDEPLVTTATETDSLLAATARIWTAETDQWLRQMTDPTGHNVVILAYRPQSNKVPVLKPKTLIRAFNAVNDADLTPYTPKSISGPLLTREPVRGSIIKCDSMPELDCRIYTLSNGVRVMAKKTNFKPGQFIMRGISPGGLSQKYTTELAPTMLLIDDIIATYQYGNFSATDLRRLTADKDMKVGVSIKNTHELVDMISSPVNMDDAFRLLILKMTDARPDTAAYAVYAAATADRLAQQYTSPVQIMGDSIHRNVYSHHPLGVKGTPATVAAACLDSALSIYRDRFADCSDFSFYAVGDFEWDKLTDLMERYLASLPTNGRIEKPRDIGYRYAQGVNTIHFTASMQTHQAIVYTFLTGHTSYDIKNHIVASAAGQILKRRLLDDLREKRGWTYSIQGHCGINPDMNGSDAPAFIWPTYIKVAPEHAKATESAITEAFRTLASQAPTSDEWNKVKEYMLKNNSEAITDNGFWISALSIYDRYGINYVADYVSTIDNITTEDIRAFTEEALASGNITRLMLTPHK